ncbi:hypothetical protein B0H14DRAFT_2601663 [Mycena olivaceomarginata]|nr:hypothetical protein B0H14DRAFT_2601663 [Mycena olivaceomarginata]
MSLNVGTRRRKGKQKADEGKTQIIRISWQNCGDFSHPFDMACAPYPHGLFDRFIERIASIETRFIREEDQDSWGKPGSNGHTEGDADTTGFIPDLTETICCLHLDDGTSISLRNSDLALFTVQYHAKTRFNSHNPLARQWVQLEQMDFDLRVLDEYFASLKAGSDPYITLFPEGKVSGFARDSMGSISERNSGVKEWLQIFSTARKMKVSFTRRRVTSRETEFHFLMDKSATRTPSVRLDDSHLH